MTSEKFYIVFSQRDCDDPYYPPYADVIRVYKSKEKAIEHARRIRKRTKKYSRPEDCYYVEEYEFQDEDHDIFKDYSSSDDDDNNDNENYKKYKEDMKKYYYYGEDEEKYFDETDETDECYKKRKMVYVISRKSNNKNKNEDE